jgi:hypothetical protein
MFCIGRRATCFYRVCARNGSHLRYLVCWRQCMESQPFCARRVRKMRGGVSPAKKYSLPTVMRLYKRHCKRRISCSMTRARERLTDLATTVVRQNSWNGGRFKYISSCFQRSRSHVLRHGLSQHWNQLGAGIALHDVSARTSRDCLPCELGRLGQAHDEN